MTILSDGMRFWLLPGLGQQHLPVRGEVSKNTLVCSRKTRRQSTITQVMILLALRPRPISKDFALAASKYFSFLIPSTVSGPVQASPFTASLFDSSTHAQLR